MLKIKGIELIFDQGTAPYQEDGFIIDTPFFGVVDGFSAPHNKKVRQILFKGMSGGEMVRQKIILTFCSIINKDLKLEEIIWLANQEIGKVQEGRGIPLSRTDLLAGASFAFAKIKNDWLEIIQGGDSFALWLDNSEKIGITENQVYLHEKEELKTIAELMKKHYGDRKKMWIEFTPILSKRRLAHVNKETKKGYAQLNGQSTLSQYWKKISIIKPRLLLLFTDGLVSFEETASPMLMAKKVLETFQKGGLDLLLKERRETETKIRKTSYIDYQEATALAITFKK